MKKIILVLSLFFIIGFCSAYLHNVDGYTREDGVYVNGYTRTDPDGFEFNNKSNYDKSVCPYGIQGVPRQHYDTLVQADELYIKNAREIRTKYGLWGRQGGSISNNLSSRCYYPIDEEQKIEVKTEREVIKEALGDKVDILNTVFFKIKEKGNMEALEKIIPIFKKHKKKEVQLMGRYLELLIEDSVMEFFETL